ncbi:hypothetical protein [Limosilactobacillus portuensis]|nr:hypothetical protein [Limosilactobacillus portuensis]
MLLFGTFLIALLSSPQIKSRPDHNFGELRDDIIV